MYFERSRVYRARPDLQLMKTKEEALIGADALAIATEWQAFRSPNFDLIKQRLTYPLIFDGRNLYDPHDMVEKGFVYKSIGRS